MHGGVSSDAAIGTSTASGLSQRWSVSLGSSGYDQASPAVAYNTKLRETVVYAVSYRGVVSALNAATGTLVWQRSLGSMVESSTPVYQSSPAVYGGTVYVGDHNGTLHALNAATGAVRCTFTLPAMTPGQFISSPVIKNVDGTGPTVFIGDSVSNRGAFWAITGAGNTAGGCRAKWMYDNWTDNEHIGVWDSPALTKNSQGTWEVVFGTSDPDESVYALDAVNGSPLWRFQTAVLGPDEDVGAGPTIGPPGANGFADGVVYIDGKDGIEYALDLLTGQKLWSFTLGPGSAQSYGVSEAALVGSELVVCYDTSVFALDARTGSQLWTATLGQQIWASPAVAGPPGQQVLFIGDRSGFEYGLSVQNGTQVFSAVTSPNISASAAVAAGMLYFISGGTLYAYAPS